MSKIPKITQFSNALKNLFTPSRKSAAASQPHTEEARKVDPSETRPKNRLREFFSWFKALFKRKDKDIESRNATANPDPTPIRQTTHSVLENANTGMLQGNKMVSKFRSMFDHASFHDELNVATNYVRESARHNISFTTSDGTKQTVKTLNLRPREPAGYADHLTKFCGDDVFQARRLSALLTKESLDIVSSEITGKKNCQWIEKSFDVSKAEKNDIKVEIKGMFIGPEEKPTKVDNVTILLPLTANFTQTVAIETVAFHNPDLTAATQS